MDNARFIGARTPLEVLLSEPGRRVKHATPCDLILYQVAVAVMVVAPFGLSAPAFSVQEVRRHSSSQA